MSQSHLDPALVQAYRETDYLIEGDPPLLLRVGERNPALASLLDCLCADSCAFLTACNPWSQLLGEAENEARQAQLGRQLRQRGLPFRSGWGRHPQGTWPAEASYAVFGMTLEEARQLGTQYQQNAIVWSGLSAIPQLVLLR